MTIVEFLEARIAEDEAAAKVEVDLIAATFGKVPGEFEIHYEWARHTAHVGNGARGASFASGAPDPARVLREVAAKRELVAGEGFDRCQGHPKPWMRHGQYGAGFCFTPPEGSVLYVLAAIYSDHPDFNEEWRP